MIEISASSEAYEYLVSVIANEDTYKVSLDIRASGVAIKRNEGMWTATLDAEPMTNSDARHARQIARAEQAEAAASRPATSI